MDVEPEHVTENESNSNCSESSSPVSQASWTSSEGSTNSKFLEEFDSLTVIGKGAYGRVFKARRKSDDKYYAVKIVKNNKTGLGEADTLSCLTHPNIVHYHTAWIGKTVYRNESSSSCSSSSSDSGTVGVSFLCIQMELCEEDTLREWIEERNGHPEEHPERRQEAAEIIKQVLEAVKYIHSKNLIHRDLKPENIMFGIEGDVKVGDFGFVTEEKKEEEDGSLLERTDDAGTPSYMSPEQREQSEQNRKVDIFPLGLIYFELLWRIGTQHEKQKIWHNVRSKKFPEQFSEIFAFEHKLIEQMLCENPERRPEASDLLRELDQHLATTTKHTDG